MTDDPESLAEAFPGLLECNRLCLRASDVLEDLRNVVGNPVARAHRMCPVHGEQAEVVRDALDKLNEANYEIEQWKAAYGEYALQGTLARMRAMAEKISAIRKLLPPQELDGNPRLGIHPRQIREILNRDEEE